MKIKRRTLLVGGLGGLVTVSGTGLYALRHSGHSGSRPLSAAPSNLLGRFSDLRAAEPFDVCIIGSGPAGVVLGTDLVEQGLRTVVLESGGTLEQMAANPELALLGEIVVPADAALQYPPLGTRLMALGGTSNLWTGRCSRLHPLDFQQNAYSSGWPLSYEDLEPYYTRAERTLRVRGGDSSAFQPPRSKPLPLPADSNISGLKRRMAQVGLTLNDSPTSTSATASGDPVRVPRDLLPDFVRSSNAALITDATVTKLTLAPDGRITGAEVTNLSRERLTVRARIFVVAAGAIGTTHLLALSRSNELPTGLGNEYDQLGRYFCEHPNLPFRGVVTHTLNELLPRRFELGRSDQYYDEFKNGGFGSVLLVVSQSWLRREDIKDGQRATERATNLASRLAHAEMNVGATMEMYPSESNRLTLSRDRVDHFGNPLPELHLAFSTQDTDTANEARRIVRRLYSSLGTEQVAEYAINWSHHHTGSCRMGTDPKKSVVGPDLKVHGTQNLYALTSGVFTTGGAAHPTLLITAFAHRLAGQLQLEVAHGNVAPAAA